MSGTGIRALIDTLEKIPASAFGNGRARILRKLVLVAIAKHADADGSNAMPSTATLARICLVGERAIRETVAWLEEHGLLRTEYKAGRHGCNRYRVLFPDAKPDELPGTAVPGTPGIAVPGRPGTIHAVPGTTVPRDPAIENATLPSFTEKRETEKAALSTLQENCDWITAEVARRKWSVTPGTQQIIRSALEAGRKRESVLEAIEATMRTIPSRERHAGLFLQQNLKAQIAVLDLPPRPDAEGMRRCRPSYLDEPHAAPLTGQELEEHEKNMAALREKLGIPASAAAVWE